jgi:hypothetical protein
MEFPSALDPLRSLKAVWRAVQASPGAIGGWWGLGLAGGVVIYLAFYLVVFVLLAAAGATSEAVDAPSEGAQFALGGMFLVLVLAFALAMFVAQCWWRVGLENVLADTLRTGQSKLADAWKPRGRLWAVIGAHLLVALVALGLYLPFLPGAVLVGVASEHSEALAAVLGVGLGLLWLVFFSYVALGFSLAPFSAALDPVGPIEALARSWRAARGRRLALLVFWIAAFVFALAGLLLFCVGYLATTALLILMPAEAWLALTREEERRGWWISGATAAEPHRAPVPPPG